MKTKVADDVLVYEPHKVGLPRLGPYFRDLWSRRQFAAELSRSTMRASHANTFFGRLWLVINPLLLALVYYVLVGILRGNTGGGEFFIHLVAGLFFFYFIAGCLTAGTASVTGGGKLISSMAFPRLLMPLSAVRTAFFRFLPTLIVFFLMHAVFRIGFSPVMLLGVYFLACAVIFGAGMAALFAALMVYFRDTASFLPYFVRIWLYLSPVLWYPDAAVSMFGEAGVRFANINPLFSMVGGWTETVVRAEIPPMSIWLFSAGWAIFALLAGFAYFMSREREFAVRL